MQKRPKITASSVSHSISQEQYSCDCGFWYTCVNGYFFQHFFLFFQIFDILHFEGCKSAKINHNYQFQSATLPKNQKNQNFEKTKTKYWRYNHFTSVYQKKQSYEVPLWRYGVTDSIFGHFGPFFAFLYPLP